MEYKSIRQTLAMSSSTAKPKDAAEEEYQIGPSLRYATAQVARISRQGGPVYGNPASPQPTVNTGVGGWSQRPQQSAQTQQPAAPPADDPWGAPSDDQSSFGGFGKADTEPEF